jgi:hypothetical protein
VKGRGVSGKATGINDSWISATIEKHEREIIEAVKNRARERELGISACLDEASNLGLVDTHIERAKLGIELALTIVSRSAGLGGESGRRERGR